MIPMMRVAIAVMAVKPVLVWASAAPWAAAGAAVTQCRLPTPWFQPTAGSEYSADTEQNAGLPG